MDAGFFLNRKGLALLQLVGQYRDNNRRPYSAVYACVAVVAKPVVFVAQYLHYQRAK